MGDTGDQAFAAGPLAGYHRWRGSLRNTVDTRDFAARLFI